MLTRSRWVYERSWNTCPSCTSSLSSSPFRLVFSVVSPQTSGHRKDGKGSVYVWCSVYIFNSPPPWTTRVDTSRGRSITTLLRLLLRRENSFCKKKKAQICRDREQPSSHSRSSPVVNNPAYIYIRRCCSRIDYIRPIIHIFFFPPTGFSGLLLRVYRFFSPPPRCRYFLRKVIFRGRCKSWRPQHFSNGNSLEIYFCTYNPGIIFRLFIFLFSFLLSRCFVQTLSGRLHCSFWLTR